MEWAGVPFPFVGHGGFFTHTLVKWRVVRDDIIVIVIIAVVYSWPSGAISLWAVPKVDDSCGVLCWKSARLAYEQSLTKWVQIVWDAEKRDYVVAPAEGINIEPLWPNDLDLGHLMKVGFASKLIDTSEHPYVLQLRGLAK